MAGSTKPAIKVAARAMEDSHQVDADTEDLYDKRVSSEEGNDYGSARRKGNPPTKKAKRGSSAAHAQQPVVNKVSRRKKSLSLLPSMPLDVLFEVFAHLTPEGIINLTRTSRVFRDTLMARSATSVWKTSTERFGAPECPLNMSEPRWAILLFENVCQNCGAKDIRKVDFYLLRRVCMSCKKENLVVESNFNIRYPDIDPKILELISYTNDKGGASHRSRLFWISDIENMLRKLAEYQYNVDLRLPGAQKAMEDFKVQQTEMVTTIRKLKPEREQWCHEFYKGWYQDKQAVIDQRIKSIQAKFLSLGYVTSDLASVRMTRECQHPALLTDQIWKHIRPVLEPVVLQRKRERLEREMKPTRDARRAIIHTYYQKFHKTLMPSQWKYLPRTIDICALEPFAKVLDVGPDVAVTATDFEEAFYQLPELLLASLDARRLQTRRMLKNSPAIQPASSALERGDYAECEAASSSSLPDALKLATAVFTCQELPCNDHGSKAPYLFGWDDIASHHCRLDSFSGDFWYQQRTGLAPAPSNVTFSTLGSKTAGTVVRASGLDDRVAKVSDMDLKDLRFGCSACPSQKRNEDPSWTKVGYKWRDFVLHCTVELHAAENVLVVLPTSDSMKVKVSEMSNPNRLKNLWTCGLCALHLGDLKTRQVVVEHVKSAHGIDFPREPQDLFLFERYHLRDTFQAKYPTGPPPGCVMTIHCLECASGRPAEQKRLFDLNGVKCHLAAKHKVKFPVANVHYH